MRCFNKYICRYNSQILWCNLYIHKPSRPIQWQFSHLQSWVNGNQPLDWLGDIWFWAGYKIVLCKNKQTKRSTHHSKVASMTSWWTRGRDNQAQGRRKKTLADSNYFYIAESVMRTNFCACVMPLVYALHAQLQIWEGLCKGYKTNRKTLKILVNFLILFFSVFRSLVLFTLCSHATLSTSVLLSFIYRVSCKKAYPLLLVNIQQK